MRKTLIAAITGFAVFAASSALAASDLKIGVLNLRAVFENSKRMQAVSDDLKRQLDPTKNKLVAEQKRLRDEQDKFNRESAKLSEKDKTDTRNKLMAEATALQRNEQNFIDSVQQRQSAAMKKSLDEIGNIVADIAQREHFDMVLQSGTVVYSNKNLDITDRVIAQFDARKAAANRS